MAHLDRAQAGHADFDRVFGCSILSRNGGAVFGCHIDMPAQAVQGISQHVGVPSAAQAAHIGLQEGHLILKRLVWGGLHNTEQP